MTNAGCLMRKSAARETKIICSGTELCLCAFMTVMLCLGMWIYISVHNCTRSVSVSLTARALSSITFFVTLPQASHRCSPVHQVLSTRSVNTNKKNSFPSVPAPATARQAAIQMQAVHKQPAGPSGLPACRQVSPALAKMYRHRCVQSLTKNNQKKSSFCM